MEPTVKEGGYQPTEEQAELLKLLQDTVIVDPDYKTTGICLSEKDAKRRAELVSDIEYTFSLALKKGNNYFGQAEINFYLEQMPETDDELYLNSNALAISDLAINALPRVE